MRNAIKAFVIHPVLKNSRCQDSDEDRDADSCLAEMVSLTEAIGVDVSYSKVSRISKIRPSTYLGKGEIDELSGYIAEDEVELLILDCQLSPTQQRKPIKQNFLWITILQHLF
jgi:GTP-binding protein HflX